MEKIKNIALVAHDNRKKDLIEWVEWNCRTLFQHKLICTGTTGKLIEETLKNNSMCKELELGYFDAHKRSYVRKKFNDEYEFTSFVGNVSMLDDEILIHCHVTITDAGFNAFGGHLFKGVVPATLEIVLFPFTEPLVRKEDEATGLNLLEL